MPRRLAFLLILLGCLAACSSAGSRPNASGNGGPAGFTQTGLASWYGEAHQGRRTASGERFDMNALTAAHRTLPFGTVVRVTSLATGRSVKVRINDRGPFVRGRIIDLSAKAASLIGLRHAGVARVRIEALALVSDAIDLEAIAYAQGEVMAGEVGGELAAGGIP